MTSYCVRQMDGLPDGRIKISHRGNIDYYYHVTGEGKDNLVDKEVAHKIAQRSYYEKFLKAARAEERMLKQMMDRLFLLGETGDCPFDVRTLDVLIEEMFL